MAMIRGARIDEIFAYTCIDEQDDVEGIVSAMSPMGMVPLVGADIERMLSYKPAAQAAAEATGQTIKLVRFTSRQEIEEL